MALIAGYAMENNAEVVEDMAIVMKKAIEYIPAWLAPLTPNTDNGPR
jgi:hypothetical protein